MSPHRRLLRNRYGGRARASFNLVVPLAARAPVATDMRTADTAGQLDLFSAAGPASGAVSPLIGRPDAGLRQGDVKSTTDRSTPATPSTPGCRTSATATRTTTTRATSTWRGRSADGSGAGISYAELLAAYLDCRRTKRNTKSARDWEINQESNLDALHEALNDGTYTPGPSICFAITRPKRREVWAAGFQDRIVHHALYRHIGPRFERAFIADSCACIAGRGTLYAARRLEAKVRSVTRNWTRPVFYLKCDLANFFPSIDKRKLWALLAPRVPEPFWRDLAARILFHDPRPGVELRGDKALLARIAPQKSLFGRPAHLGLPIGNLSSQFGANVYLNELDQFVKHRLHVRHYIRYVDDFVLLHESPQQLNAWREAIEAFLPARLAVQLNPAKTILQPIARGIDFVGQVIAPHRRTARRRTFNEALRRVEAMPAGELAEAATSYLGLFRQSTRSHTDRARLANAARRAIGTVDVQGFIADIGTTSANGAVGCLSSAFMWGKRTGKTTYNPCEGAAKITQEGREREPKAWEVECLGAMAEYLGRRRLALMIDFESISGWRCIDMRKLVRRQLTPEGIRHRAQKNGKRALLEWNDDLKRIIREAFEQPGAKRAGIFPLSPVFASREGKELSGNAFWDSFRLLVRQTNEALAECEIPLEIDDLGFHDLRSKAGDDAEDAGMDMHEFLGNTEAVARKHYARRERKVVPLTLKR